MEGVRATEFAPAAKYCNFSRLSRYLDPHMSIGVIESFYFTLGIYDEKSLLNTLLELTSRTKLAQNKNKYLQLRAQLPSANVGADAETPESILESTLEELKRESAALEAAMGPLIDIVGVNVSVSYEFVTGESLVRDVRVEPPQLKQLREDQEFTMLALSEKFGVTEAHVEAMFKMAKFQYDAGEYSASIAYLDLYQELTSDVNGPNIGIYWGKLAACIQNYQDGDGWDKSPEWEKAFNLAWARDGSIDSAIRERYMPDIKRLQERTWLLHWSLNILAEYPSKREALLDIYLRDENLLVVSLTCPWLLRYIITTLLLFRKKHHLVSKVVRLLTPEALALGDPMIKFLQSVAVDFDFEAAKAVMNDCCRAIVTDPFLKITVLPEHFREVARRFLFDVQCRVCQKIDLTTVSDMQGDDAERWVADLVRSAQENSLSQSLIYAKVDSEEKTMSMRMAPSSFYWSILDKSNHFAHRTRMLYEQIEAAESKN